MAQAMDDIGLAAEMSRARRRAARPAARPRPAAAGSGCAATQPLGLGDATSALAGARRPRRARVRARPGLPGRQPRRHRRGGGPPRARPPGGRRPGGAAPARARAAARRATSTSDGGELELTPKAVRRLGRHRAAPGLRRPGARARSRRPRHARRRRGRRADRRDPGVAVRRRAAARRRPHRAQRGAAIGRRGRRAAAGCGCTVEDFEVVETERRTRGRGLPAGRPVVLDGAARHLGGGEGDRAGAARAGARRSTRRTRSRSSASPTTPGSCTPTELAGLDWDMVQGTNLQHALMLAGRSPRQAPRRRAGGAGRHRRRADRAPDARTAAPWFDWPPAPETSS